MLSTRLKQLLDDAVKGNINAFKQFQIEKLDYVSNDRRQAFTRINYYKEQKIAAVKYVLAKKDLSTCSTSLLYYIATSMGANRSLLFIDHDLTSLLEISSIKCLTDPNANRAGMAFFNLLINRFIFQNLTHSAYKIALFNLLDDNEGFVSYQQHLVLLEQKNEAAAKEALTKSLAKNNFLARADTYKKNMDMVVLENGALAGHAESRLIRAKHLWENSKQISDPTKKAECHTSVFQDLMIAIDNGLVSAMHFLAEINLTHFSDNAAKTAEAIVLLQTAVGHKHVKSIKSYATYLSKTENKSPLQILTDGYQALQLLANIQVTDSAHDAELFNLKEKIFRQLKEAELASVSGAPKATNATPTSASLLTQSSTSSKIKVTAPKVVMPTVSKTTVSTKRKHSELANDGNAAPATVPTDTSSTSNVSWLVANNSNSTSTIFSTLPVASLQASSSSQFNFPNNNPLASSTELPNEDATLFSAPTTFDDNFASPEEQPLFSLFSNDDDVDSHYLQNSADPAHIFGLNR